MTTKTITVTKEAYDRLKSRKRGEESFSEAILRIAGRPPLTDFAGILDPGSARALRAAVDRTRGELRSADRRRYARR